MSVAICSVCGASPNIKVNGLCHCCACFKRQLHRKVSRNLRGFSPQSKVLLYLDGTFSSLVAAHVIKQACWRIRHGLKAFYNGEDNERKELLQILEISEHGHSGKIPMSQETFSPLPDIVVDIAKQGGFDAVVFQLSAEMEAMVALRSICRGAGTHETILTQVSKIQGIRAINAFSNVGLKEIGYYFYLNRNEIPQGRNVILTGMEAVLLSSIARMQRRNELVCFNILSTTRKIGVEYVSEDEMKIEEKDETVCG